MTSLTDYKIWCFHGKPYCILTCSNRKGQQVRLGSYDLDWNYHPEHLIASANYPQEPVPLPRPQKLEEMLSIATILSKPFPQVRVDLYNIDGKIYFGEMTFTALGGLMSYYTDEFQRKAGSMINL